MTAPSKKKRELIQRPPSAHTRLARSRALSAGPAGPLPCAARLAPLCALAAALALGGCAQDTAPQRPPEYRTTLDELLLENARRCDSGFEYPAALVEGIGTQLVEELRCMDDTILEFYESCEDVGCIKADGPQPRALRPEVITALHAAARERDDFISISAGYRDVGMQYYSRWYNENCDSSFDAAIPGQSNHQGGRAIDVRYYNYWWDTLLNNGFEHPIVTDNPHFELVGTAAFRARSAELQSLSVMAYQRLWNRNNPDDRIAEDGIYGASTKARLGLAPVEGFPIGACAPGSEGGDVGVDAGPEVGLDAGTDATSDATSDIAADVREDVSPEVGPDADTDASTDASTGADTDEDVADTSVDARQDAGAPLGDTSTPEVGRADATTPPLPLYSLKSSRDPQTRGCAASAQRSGQGSAPTLGLLLCGLLLARRRR